MRKALVTVAAVVATSVAASVSGVFIGNAIQGDEPASPSNSPNVQSLPDQVPIGGPGGVVVGYADRDELFALPPAHAAGTPAANKPVDVHTKAGGHVGWAVPGIGFMTEEQFNEWRKAGSPMPTTTHEQNPDGSETITVAPSS